MNKQKVIRVLVGIVGLSIAGFSFLWVQYALEARRAWQAGETALSEQNKVVAQGHFERAIRSHCPFNTWGRRAAERLETMAQGYEKAGDIARAISAYESLMTSLAAIDTGWSRARREKAAALENKVLLLRSRLSAENRRGRG